MLHRALTKLARQPLPSQVQASPRELGVAAVSQSRCSRDTKGYLFFCKHEIRNIDTRGRENQQATAAEISQA